MFAALQPGIPVSTSAYPASPLKMPLQLPLHLPLDQVHLQLQHPSAHPTLHLTSIPIGDIPLLAPYTIPVPFHTTRQAAPVSNPLDLPPSLLQRNQPASSSLLPTSTTRAAKRAAAASFLYETSATDGPTNPNHPTFSGQRHHDPHLKVTNRATPIPSPILASQPRENHRAECTNPPLLQLFARQF